MLETEGAKQYAPSGFFIWEAYNTMGAALT